VDWPLAWLLTYSGSDCELWGYVYSKCMEAGLCRELAKMFINELRKHKCFALLIDDLNDIVPCCLKANQTPQSPNQPKHPKQNHQSSSKPKPLNRSAAYALSLSLKSLKPTSPLPTPHSSTYSSGAPPGSRGFGVEPSPALGGSPPPDHWVQ
jgi:hypothetical protein